MQVELCESCTCSRLLLLYTHDERTPSFFPSTAITLSCLTVRHVIHMLLMYTVTHTVIEESRVNRAHDFECAHQSFLGTSSMSNAAEVVRGSVMVFADQILQSSALPLDYRTISDLFTV